MKRLFSLILVVLLALVLVGCASTTETNSEKVTEEENLNYPTKIAGEWEIKEDGYEDTITFETDGLYHEIVTENIDDKTVTYNVNGSWEVEGDELYYTAEDVDGQKKEDFKSLDGIELTQAQIDAHSYYFDKEPSKITIKDNKLTIENKETGKTLEYTKVETKAETN